MVAEADVETARQMVEVVKAARRRGLAEEREAEERAAREKAEADRRELDAGVLAALEAAGVGWLMALRAAEDRCIAGQPQRMNARFDLTPIGHAPVSLAMYHDGFGWKPAAEAIPGWNGDPWEVEGHGGYARFADALIAAEEAGHYLRAYAPPEEHEAVDIPF